MAETLLSSPNLTADLRLSTSREMAQPPVTSDHGGWPIGLWRRRPEFKVTTEYDSDAAVFAHKLSCKLASGLAKLRFSFMSDTGGGQQFVSPIVGFVTRHLSVFYDVERCNAIVEGDMAFGDALVLSARHDIQEQQGEVSLHAKLGHPSYKLQLTSQFPHESLPRAILRFPLGEVSVDETVNEKEEKVTAIKGFMKWQFLSSNTLIAECDEGVNLKVQYKDSQLTWIPSISLPSNAVAVQFKRRFGPSDKLSYMYNFASNDWNAIYKHTVGEHFKLKAGYDTEVRLGWMSFWVGREDGSTKTAPMKTRLQLMLQVPQDDIGHPIFMFRVKKRWDF